jgi:hypothetical protein
MAGVRPDMSQCHFFASPDDLLRVFDRVESQHSISFVLAGMFETSQFAVFHAGAALPTLRSPAGRQSIECPTYLVMPVSTPINVRSVPQRTGGVSFAIDQLENPDSTTLTHGGFHSPDVLISGRVATVSVTPTGKKLQSAFSRAIAKQFTRVKAFYVGPEAYNCLQQGCRLTFNVDAPPEYDLERPRASA